MDLFCEDERDDIREIHRIYYFRRELDPRFKGPNDIFGQ